MLAEGTGRFIIIIIIFLFYLFHHIFQRKTLVTKMMDIRGRASGWSRGQTGVNISFPKHTSATVRNILMALGRIIQRSVRSVACKNDNSSYLQFLIIFPDPYLYFISGPYLSLIYFNDTL